MPDWNWHKTKQKLSTILRLNFRYLKIIHIIHPRYHPQDNRRYSKKYAKKQVRLFKWVYMMNDNENKTRSRHGHKYPKNKMCLSMIMLVCIKQHLSNIWSSIHEEVKQHWGWIKKKMRCLSKKPSSCSFFTKLDCYNDSRGPPVTPSITQSLPNFISLHAINP